MPVNPAGTLSVIPRGRVEPELPAHYARVAGGDGKVVLASKSRPKVNKEAAVTVTSGCFLY